MKKDLVSIKDLTIRDLTEIFNLTDKVKRAPARFNKRLKGKMLARHMDL